MTNLIYIRATYEWGEDRADGRVDQGARFKIYGCVGSQIFFFLPEQKNTRHGVRTHDHQLSFSPTVEGNKAILNGVSMDTA